jgi:hypothetical protein
MPNLIHTILRIEKPVKMDGDDAHHRDARPCVSTTKTSADNQSAPGGVAHRAPKSISSFVAGFKSAATKRINAFRETPGMPVWQARFHDHIIRDENHTTVYGIILIITPRCGRKTGIINKEIVFGKR